MGKMSIVAKVAQENNQHNEMIDKRCEEIMELRD